MITMLFTNKILLAWYNSFMTIVSCFIKYFYDVKIYIENKDILDEILDDNTNKENSIVISNGYDATLAYNHPGSYDTLTTEEALENGTWHQLRTMYYRDPHNLYTSYGTIKPTYTDIERVKQRVLNATNVRFNLFEWNFYYC